jgi:hypothetical protein
MRIGLGFMAIGFFDACGDAEVLCHLAGAFSCLLLALGAQFPGWGR